MPPRKLQQNWISSYAAAMNPITESPDAYVIWSAISVISAVLKKKVWVDRGTYLIYPNQYIVLVGPPGIGKGAAIHPAHSFIKDYNQPKLANYLSDRQTAPEIIKKLADGFQSQSVVNGTIAVTTESAAIIMATELSTFLGSSDWMAGFLCDTWDKNEYDYGTKNKGDYYIKNMCVSLIGACVPDFIRRVNGHINATDAVNGGFTARTIFVFANEKSKSLPWPLALKNTLNGNALITALREDLETIAKLKGEYKLDPAAFVEWVKFYDSIKAKDEDSDVIRHFKSRQNVHVLKVAMCLSAANDDSLVINNWCLQTAITLVQGVLNTLDVTFRGVGESSLSEATAKVQTYIERKGLTTRRELIRDNHRHATVEDIDRILNTLMQIGIVTGFTHGGQQFYEHFGNTRSGTPGKTP